MSSKNVVMGLWKPYSCFDCQCKILSDVNVSVLEAVDWTSFKFLEKCSSRGRRPVHSKVAMLRALIYMELRRIGSVRQLVKVLGSDKYIMKILGLDRLPDHSTFSKFKKLLSKHLDRIMSLLNSMTRLANPHHMSLVGVDSTILPAYSMKDGDADWGYDHISKEYYKGYRVHILYDLPSLSPLCFTLTKANVHDNTQVRPLIKKFGANTLNVKGFFADRGYDSKENIKRFLNLGIPMICRRNKRNSHKPEKKYRLQDYLPVHGNKLNKLYKNRMDCEYTNNLLKEHLNMTRVNTISMFRTKIKVGLTMIARQIQVLYLTKQRTNPRTAIII